MAWREWMTPIVFCASLVPWINATSEAVAIWPQRKPCRRRVSSTLRVIRYPPVCLIGAGLVTGAATAGIGTSCAGPVVARQIQRSRARADRPPKNANDERDGIATAGVNSSTGCRRWAGEMSLAHDARYPYSAPVLPSCTFSTEVVTVTATSTERKEPTRLRTPPHRSSSASTRLLIVSPRVAGVVQPSVRPNASAAAITAPGSSALCSRPNSAAIPYGLPTADLRKCVFEQALHPAGRTVHPAIHPLHRRRLPVTSIPPVRSRSTITFRRHTDQKQCSRKEL